MSRRILARSIGSRAIWRWKIEIRDDRVSEAWVTSPMYRGFEQILHGRGPRDALVYTPRVCGICSVSQSVAAADALSSIEGVERPPNGELAINLIHACENLADHFTHFYLFSCPTLRETLTGKRRWHADVAARFRGIKGSAASPIMGARAGLRTSWDCLQVSGHTPVDTTRRQFARRRFTKNAADVDIGKFSRIS